MELVTIHSFQGITGGDRLLSVNGNSLTGKDRHETVELVRRSGTTVRLEIFRSLFPHFLFDNLFRLILWFYVF